MLCQVEPVAAGRDELVVSARAEQGASGRVWMAHDDLRLTKGWAVVVPTTAWAGGFGAALLIGAVAGLLPAIRAARLSPADALRTV
jgi:hypothetical protein